MYVTCLTSVQQNGTITKPHSHEVQVVINRESCGRSWFVVWNGTGDTQTYWVTLFVQLVQVPNLDNRIYPRFIFLLEFCIQTLTYKSRAKYHDTLQMNGVHAQGYTFLLLLQFGK